MNNASNSLIELSFVCEASAAVDPKSNVKKIKTIQIVNESTIYRFAEENQPSYTGHFELVENPTIISPGC